MVTTKSESVSNAPAGTVGKYEPDSYPPLASFRDAVAAVGIGVGGRSRDPEFDDSSKAVDELTETIGAAILAAATARRRASKLEMSGEGGAR